jgi:hypothetical protein
MRKGARSFLDNRLVTERRRRDFAGGRLILMPSRFCAVYLCNRGIFHQLPA